MMQKDTGLRRSSFVSETSVGTAGQGFEYPEQMPPTFVIIGAAKAGTTAMHRFLEKHPQVYMSAEKETHFFALDGRDPGFQAPGDEQHFNRRCIYRPRSYVEQFTTPESMSEDVTARGESSPSYLYYPFVAERLAVAKPEIKLIVLLRDPVERAHSSYVHLCRAGSEDAGSFERGLALEDERVAANFSFLWHYRRASRYAEQLKPYFERFPREQILVLHHEDFLARPENVFRRVLGFIGVDPDFTTDLRVKHNVSVVTRSETLASAIEGVRSVSRLAHRFTPSGPRRYLRERIESFNKTKPNLSSSLRRRLISDFSEQITGTEELLQTPLDAWRRV